MLRDAESRLQVLSCLRERQLQGLRYREVVLERPWVNYLWWRISFLNETRDCSVLGWNTPEGIYLINASFHWTLQVI
jgi:hypothetical protein